MRLCVPDNGSILAQEKVYIQWRKAKKLHLLIGGHAYLLPRTTLLLRCPTHHFRKGRLRWLKDGKPLASVPHVSLTPLADLKIQQVRSSDAGTYTCVAGSARQRLVLQVIGSNRKLAAPDRYGSLVEQLLQLGRSLQPEDEAWGQSSVPVLIADPYRLDQLLSGGALGGRELLQQLTATQGDANESTLAPEIIGRLADTC